MLEIPLPQDIAVTSIPAGLEIVSSTVPDETPTNAPVIITSGSFSLGYKVTNTLTSPGSGTRGYRTIILKQAIDPLDIISVDVEFSYAGYGSPIIAYKRTFVAAAGEFSGGYPIKEMLWCSGGKGVGPLAREILSFNPYGSPTASYPVGYECWNSSLTGYNLISDVKIKAARIYKANY